MFHHRGTEGFATEYTEFFRVRRGGRSKDRPYGLGCE